MTLKEIERDNGSIHKVLTECPFCETHFGEKPNGGVRTSHFLNEHGKEVFPSEPDEPCPVQTGLDEWAGAD